MPNQSRYPGTRPFEEEDKHLFFGRRPDQKKLGNLIVLEKLVVLYGKSGYGKSSLLNAAVVPYLRDFKGHIPYKIRLVPQEDKSKDTAISPLKIIVDHLEGHKKSKSFLDDKLNIPGKLPEDFKAILWFYIKSNQISQPDSEAITLVFYQFEELFRYYKDPEWEAFGRSFAALLNLNPPDTVLELISQHLSTFSDEELDLIYKPLNLKVVFSIASDHLNLLNKLKPYLPEIFKYTYELKALGEAYALKALEEPAQKEGDFFSPEFTYSDEAKEEILNYLKGRDKEGVELSNQDIETFQLQLIGQYAEEKIRDKKKKAEVKPLLGKKKVAQEPQSYVLEARDLGKPEKILKKFYHKAIKEIKGRGTRKDARGLIQDDLIKSGNRVAMSGLAIKDKYAKLSDETLGKLEDEHLLRSEHQLKDNYTAKSYEISHYNLVKPIQESARRRKQKMRWIFAIAIFLVIVAALLGCIAYLLFPENTEEIPKPTVIETIEEVEGSNGLIINAIGISTAWHPEGTAPHEVRFTFTKVDSLNKVKVVRFYWESGDGAKSPYNVAEWDHVYSIPGNYTARLNVVCTDSLERPMRTEDVPILVKPPVKISAMPESGASPLEVSFSATITNGINIKEYLWEFGDPSPSKIANPTHRYTRKGIYKVRLTVKDSAGIAYMGSTQIAVDMPDILTSQPPVARITRFDPEGETDPLTYGYSAEESEDDIGIVRYLWEFHDQGSSTDLRTTHTFASAETYIVKLSVWDVDGQLGTDLDTVIVTDPPTPIGPVPIIGASVTRGLAPLDVTFTGGNANDTGSPNSYKWNFKDGNGATDQNPMHVFTRSGKFNVALEVSDNGRIGTDFIQIIVDPPPPVAVAEPKEATGKVPFRVQFTGGNSMPKDSILNYYWDFKDAAATSDQKDPSHTFEESGIYKVYLTVTNGATLTARDSVTITVLPDGPPVARGIAKFNSNGTKIVNFEGNTAAAISGIEPLAITFDGKGSTDDGTISSYYWDFGDGQTSNEAVILHTFVDDNKYDVKLTVKDDIGQPSVAMIPVTVDSIKPVLPDTESKKWLERFIGVQEIHLPQTFDNPNAWKKWRIIPDSLNIVGILLPDALIARDSTLNAPAALLFFFTTKDYDADRTVVYKFRNEINPRKSESNLRSERFSYNGLIREAKRNSENSDAASRPKFIAPDSKPVHVDKSTFKNFAGLLEQNRINDKTLNVYYTLFPYAYFDEETRKEIDMIFLLLGRNNTSVVEEQ